jgi:hypothetical protein
MDAHAMADGVAACAVHPERDSTSTCARCGRFTCAACAQSSPCLECQVRQREASPRLVPLLDRLIGVSAVIYALCTLAIIPAVAPLDFTHLKPNDLFQTPMLILAVIQTVYSVAWMALIGLWLAWYLSLHDWAAARAVQVPSKLMAIVGALTCGLNFVHPLRTLRSIRRETSVRTPLELWWGLTWGSLVLATVRMPQAFRGGYEPGFILASVLEVIAVLLCWKIVRDFRLADEAWDPRAQLATRG